MAKKNVATEETTRTRIARTKVVTWNGKAVAVNDDEFNMAVLRKIRDQGTDTDLPFGRTLGVVNLETMTKSEAQKLLSL